MGSIIVEWIRGGYSYFSPQEFRFKEELANQEGSLFFCGEHTSDKPASMNGALESGIRAALEVLVARKSNVIETKEIIPIRSILEVESYFLSSGKTLAAFDIDDTLTILRDPAFQRPNFKVHHAGVFDEIMSSLSVEEKILAFTLPLLTTSSDLIEQETKELFARMQRRENTKAVAITAAMGGKIEEVAIEDRRIDELQRVGIDFSPYFPDIISEIVFPEFSNPMMGRSPFFKKGVILANEHDKGDVLVHFLKNISWIPDQLIIVDDREEHLHAVKRAIRSYNPHIDVIALHYQAVPNAYKAADVEHFKKQWMQMGEQAKKILEKMTAAAKYLNK